MMFVIWYSIALTHETFSLKPQCYHIYREHIIPWKHMLLLKDGFTWMKGTLMFPIGLLGVITKSFTIGSVDIWRPFWLELHLFQTRTFHNYNVMFISTNRKGCSHMFLIRNKGLFCGSNLVESFVFIVKKCLHWVIAHSLSTAALKVKRQWLKFV